MIEYVNEVSFLCLLYFTMTFTIFQKGEETYMPMFNPVRILNIFVKRRGEFFKYFVIQ